MFAARRGRADRGKENQGGRRGGITITRGNKTKDNHKSHADTYLPTTFNHFRI